MLSTLSLISLSSKSLGGLFGSVFIGAQVTFTVVLSGLSVPKTSLSATPTREIALLPTKCVLSTGSILFPRVCVAIVFTAVVSASLLCILRFTSSSRVQKHNDVISKPPSPPPEPGSSSSAVKTPRRIRWLLFLMIALLVLLIIAASVAACVYFAYSLPPAVQELASFCSDKLSATETRFWDGFFAAGSYAATIVAYICSRGLQDSKFLSMAFATHFICLLLSTTLRRLRWCLIRYIRNNYMEVCVCLVTIGVVAFSRLSWTLWVGAYVIFYPSPVLRIRWTLVRVSAAFSSAVTPFNELSAIIGIVVIHTSLMGFCTAFLLLFGLLSTFRGLVQRLKQPGELCCLFGASLSLIIIFPIQCLILWSALYTMGHSDVRVLCRKAFSSRESREIVKATFWFLVHEYQDWKATQIADIREFTSVAPNTLLAILGSCLGTWCNLHLSRKLLCAGPALVFYGYFHIVRFLHLCSPLWAACFLDSSDIGDVDASTSGKGDVDNRYRYIGMRIRPQDLPGGTREAVARPWGFTLSGTPLSTPFSLLASSFTSESTVLCFLKRYLVVRDVAGPAWLVARSPPLHSDRRGQVIPAAVLYSYSTLHRSPLVLVIHIPAVLVPPIYRLN
ncbi:hypothetical protein C8R43DRAFT_955285 [Mycena crocata]|nr:hypothetical protein C8R43DRAFT_955285 [Mycena crocata]